MRKRDMRNRLKQIEAEYEANYVFLERYQDNPKKHRPFLKKEHALQRECVALQRDLDIYLYDPCPLSKGITCKNCTGRYVTFKVEKTTLKGKKYMANVSKMVDIGGEKCQMKEPIRRLNGFN